MVESISKDVIDNIAAELLLPVISSDSFYYYKGPHLDNMDYVYVLSLI